MTAQAQNQPYALWNDMQLSLENKGLFSQEAQALVAQMLGGKVEICSDDIQLETTEENSFAILVSDRLACHPEFKKLLAETSCLSMLKELARRFAPQ